MSQPNKPEVVSLTHDEVEGLKKRLIESTLNSSDQKTLIAVLSLNFWLQTQLARAKLSIQKLKSLFNIKTEKKSR
jgi:hypothetical protein